MLELSLLFSAVFLLKTRNHLCFLQHSRFALACGNPTLCFHRHSHFVPSLLRNSLLLSSATNDFSSLRSQGGLWPFRPACHMIEPRLGRRGSVGAKHSRKPPPPSELQLTILAYYFPRVKRQGVHRRRRLTCAQVGNADLKAALLRRQGPPQKGAPADRSILGLLWALRYSHPCPPPGIVPGRPASHGRSWR